MFQNLIMRMLFSAIGFGAIFYFSWYLFFDYFFMDIMGDFSVYMRGADDPMMMYGVPFSLFLMGFIFSFLYKKFYHSLPGSNFMKGLMLGFYMWLFVAIGYGFFEYTLSTTPADLMMVWGAMMAVAMLLGGGAVGMIMGDAK